VISLNLCKGYLNVVTFKIAVLLQIKKLTILIQRTHYCDIVYRNNTLRKMLQFFGYSVL